MKKLNSLFTLVLIVSTFHLTYSQVITTDPTAPTASDLTVVTFDATQGDGGLAGYTGDDVYAHTGVITTESTSESDWKHDPAWLDNSEKYHLTRVEGDLWSLNISPSINDYYEIEDGEIVLQMAFVFRNSDGSITGRDVGGADIFTPVNSYGIAINITSPANQSIYFVDETIPIQATAEPINSDDVSEFNVSLDDELLVSETNTINTSIEISEAGGHELYFFADNGTYQAEKTINFLVLDGEVEEAELPEGVIDGINYIDNNTVTLVLHAPYKDFVLVIGDFNDWNVSINYLMKRTPDGNKYWLTIDGLTAGQEYAFQYYVDGEIRIADPYTDKILDPWNDSSIPSSVYPDLMDYPYEKTSEIASILQTAQEPYEWVVDDFTPPPVDELVIYEVLLRDFTEESSIAAAREKLDYLEDLGVNAVELMPINEFEGNDSWGYNPSFYFAPDKYYGTKDAYKAFIDECHQRGMAVIIDLVLNHSYGQSPFVRLYSVDYTPTAENPWYNESSNFQNPDAQWGSDFDHNSWDTRNLVDRINAYWMSEYKVDGFRFDFTKGFSNTPYGPSSWGSDYDSDRIFNLKRMSDAIWENNEDAIVIFEHLAENSEEKELANYGILLWGNLNYNYNEATMGWNEDNKSDFSWISYQKRGWNDPHVVGYMESHDEERLMYKNKMWGNHASGYDIQFLNTGLRRIELAMNFFIPIPGPKMIWQFGEMGYDYSINYCPDGTIDEGCRTARKPVRWDYFDYEVRQRPYYVYSTLNQLKLEHDVFNTTDYTLDVDDALKSIHLNDAEMNVTILGNFDVVEDNITPEFQHTGTWYELFSGESMEVNDVNAEITLEPGEYRFYSDIQLETPEIPENISIFSGKNDTGSVLVYPNPAEGSVTFAIYSQFNKATEIEIFNLTGQKVKSIPVKLEVNNITTKELQFSNEQFSTGMYFYKLNLNNKTEKGVLIIQ